MTRANPYVSQERQKKAEAEAAKHLGETVTVPPRQDEKPIDPTRPVFATGEPFANWFSRRYDSLASLHAPGVALSLAHAPISDEEMRDLSKAIRAASRPFGLGDTPEKATQRRNGVVPEETLPEVLEELIQRLTFVPVGNRSMRVTTGGPTPAIIEFLRTHPEYAAKQLADLRKDQKGPGGIGGFIAENIALPIAQAGSNVAKGVLGIDLGESGSEAQRALLAPTATATVGPDGEGAAEVAYHGVSRPVTTGVTHAAEQVAFAAESAIHGIDKLLPGADGPAPQAPSLRQTYEDVVRMGPGRAVAYHGGLQPGTAPFKVVSGTYDFFARMTMDPINLATGHVGRGYKLAKLLPKGATAADNLPVGVRFGAELAGGFKAPEDIVHARLSRKVLNAIWKEKQRIVQRAAKTGEAPNAFALADAYDIPTDRALDILEAKTRDELDNVFIDGMYGRMSARSAEDLARQREGALAAAKSAEEKLPSVGDDAARAELESTIRGAKRMADDIAERLETGYGRSVIRQIPDPTPLRTIRNTLRRPEYSALAKTPFGKAVEFLHDADWAQNVNRLLPARGRIPHRGISFMRDDIDDSARDLADALKLFGINRKDIDSLTTEFINATSIAERRSVYTRALRHAEAKGAIPRGLAGELTQMVDNPSAASYWVAENGKGFAGWAKRVERYGSEQLYEQPIFPYQLAESAPLPDLRALVQARSLTKRFESFLRGAGESGSSRFLGHTPVLSQMGRLIAGGMNVSSHAMTVLTSLWVPLVLAPRFVGWPARVVGDEILRLHAIGVHPLEEQFLNVLGRLGLRSAKDLDVPERALANYGRLVEEVRFVSRAPIAKGQKNYVAALADDINALHNDKVARYVLTHSEEESLAWLRKGEGRQYLTQFDSQLKAMGRTEVEWVQTMKAAGEATIGRSEALKTAVRTGFFKRTDGTRVRIDSVAARDELSSMVASSPGELPAAARGSGEFWRVHDDSMMRRATAVVMNAIGSKPTNTLTRAPAFRIWHDEELDRLASLGVSRDLAERQAREYAIRQVGQILYDGAERSAFDVTVRNFLPFFPAWKEVASRWLHTIPAQSGLGIGHLNLVRRGQILAAALTEEGVLRKTPEGQWELGSPGFDRFLQDVLNVEDLVYVDPISGEKVTKKPEFGFSMNSFNMLSSWPSFGPAPTLVVAEHVKKSEKYDEIISKFYPYGVDGSLGPRAVSRILRGLGLPVPWEMFDRKYQDALWDFSVADVVRTRYADIINIAKMPAATDEQRQAKRQAAQDFYESAEEQAASVMLRRGIVGLLAPVQPRVYWPGAREIAEFRKNLQAMDPDDKSSAYREFLERHPELALSLMPKTERIKGEESRLPFEERSRNELRRELVKGNLQPIPGDRLPFVMIGDINFDMIRRRRSEALAELGATGADWLRNGAEWVRINSDANAAIARLKVEDEQQGGYWQSYFTNSVNRARRRKGKPMPTLEELLDQDLARSLGVALTEFKDELAGDSDTTAAIRKVRRIANEKANLDLYYGDKELPPGPERDLAAYFAEGGPWDSYFAKVDEIRTQYIDGTKTAAQRAEGYLLLQRLRNGYGKSETKTTVARTLKVYAEPDARAATIKAAKLWNRSLGATLIEVVDAEGENVPGQFVHVGLGHPRTREDRLTGRKYTPEGEYFEDGTIRIDAELNDSTTIAHELGHALGLKHPNIDAETARGAGLMGNTSKTPDDTELKRVRKSWGIRTETVRGVKVGDQIMPTPEEVMFSMSPPEDQEARKRTWAVSPTAWLSPFQREQLSFENTDKALVFWDRVSEVRNDASAFIAAQGWPSGKKEVRVIYEALDAWEQDAAKALGLSGEYAFSKAPAYKRLSSLHLLKSDSWKRVAQVADGAWAVLRAAEKGPGSMIGQQVQLGFGQWLTGMRLADPELDSELTQLQAVAPSFVGKSVDRGFYPWLFFTEGN